MVTLKEILLFDIEKFLGIKKQASAADDKASKKNCNKVRRRQARKHFKPGAQKRLQNRIQSKCKDIYKKGYADGLKARYEKCCQEVHAESADNQ